MSVTKNTLFITGAFIAQKALTFFYVALIARKLGPEQTGQYFLALSFTTIFSVLVDLGLTPVLIREIAKYKDKTNDYFQSILTVKSIAIFFSSFLIILCVNLLSYDSVVKNLIYIAILVMVFDSLSLTSYGVLRAWQNLKVESAGIVVYQVLVVILGGGSLFFFRSVYLIISVLAFVSFLNAFYSFWLAKQKTGIKLSFLWNRKFNLLLFYASWPFFLAGVFNRIYTHIDIILISNFLNNIYVGWYAVANKLVFALQFIPSAFVASLYPAMSNYFEHSKEKLKETFEKSLVYLMVISLSICFGSLAFSSEIILTLYGNNFLNSVSPFRFLIISLVFVFLYFPIGALLNASGKQKINTANMGIAMIVNVIANFYLIPKFYLIGAAFSSVLSQATMLTLGIIYAGRVIQYNKKLVALRAGQNFFSGIFMFLFLLILKKYFYWIILIIPGAISYFLFLYLLRGISRQDIKLVWSSLRR